MNNMHSIWHCVWKYFHADESIIQSLLRMEYQSAWIFTYICVLEHSIQGLEIWVLPWAAHQWTKDLWRVIDVKAAIAIDYEWQTNFGKQDSVCMNFCIEIVPIYLLFTMTPLKENFIVQLPFSLLWNLFTAVGNSTCSLSKTLLCDTKIYFLTDI